MKLCYVIPEYTGEDHTHFAYLGAFVRELAKDFEIFLVVERGSMPPEDWGYREAHLIRARGVVFRAVRLQYALFRARLLGYRTYYVHYSFFAAYVASIIVRITGGRVFYWNCGEPWKYRRSFFRDRFERLVYRIITHLVTGTEGMKKMYAEHYGLPLDKIRVVPNWIDVERCKSENAKVRTGEVRRELRIPEGSKVLLFVHRLSKRKGAHYLPQILKELKDENVVLVIAGDGPERVNVESQISQYGLRDRVRFLGWIPQKAITRYFAVADAFLLPSEEEGFPHVLLEAMAVGMPYVAFDVGGVREITAPIGLGYVVDYGDIGRFVEASRKAISMSLPEREKIAHMLEERAREYEFRLAVRAFERMIG
jgi:glycosyltransferase involved in cell wall biosynthesis